MRVAIAGLGLIGGSFAKAIKARTAHHVTGYDIDGETQERALREGAVDGTGAGGFGACDLGLVALYPADSVEFIKSAAPGMKRGSVIIDLCGVKRYVCSAVKRVELGEGVTFIGGHPMAGREEFGYDGSLSALFEGASMILTPEPSAPPDKLRAAEDFFISLGFAGVTVTTPERHDEMISFTSQLAHVVSSAYAQCPLAGGFEGFSAGSFGDMTRVAKLNERMWTELFLRNGDYLTEQIDALTCKLKEFRDSISGGDGDGLTRLLRGGRVIKEEFERKRKMQP
ncbi:MAG: prephenate dehydrogenase [Oscillospiraceae bacterium]|jgi:prephenate dehydrogenase|nr:prephenate dehydrogenase [Oscillospiraceae bacterium]